MIQIAGKKLAKAGIVVLLLAVAMPGMAADGRPVKSRVAPTYPEIAKRMRVEGTVKLEAAVDPQGAVTDVKEVSGNHTLAVAAREALLKWKFAPSATTTNETIEISFNLGQ